jgi:hypothetical protein
MGSNGGALNLRLETDGNKKDKGKERRGTTGKR